MSNNTVNVLVVIITTIISASISVAIPSWMLWKTENERKAQLMEDKQELLVMREEYRKEISKAREALAVLRDDLKEVEAAESRFQTAYNTLKQDLALIGGFEELEEKVHELRLQVLRADGLLHDAKEEKERIELLRQQAEAKVIELERLLERKPEFQQELEDLNSIISECRSEARQGLNEARSIVREASQDFRATLDDALARLKTGSRIDFGSREEKAIETPHLAATPGWAIATIETTSERSLDGSSGRRGTVCGYAGSNQSKPGGQPRVKTSVDYKDNPQAMLTMPVRKGEYWAIDYCPISGKNRPKIDVHWVGLDLELGI